MEEWKIHPKSGYLVSESGRIINPTTNYELRPSLGQKGYLKINGNISTSCHVHCAVVEAFTGEVIPKGKYVNHKDGNKLNNHISNLEICTPSENALHAFRLGLRKAIRGEDSSTAILKEHQVLEMYKMFREGCSNSAVASHFSIKEKHVSLIRHGARWRHLYLTQQTPFPDSYTDRINTKENIIQAWELIKTTNLMNKEIADITGIEVSSISRLRHGKYAKKIIREYEKQVDNP